MKNWCLVFFVLLMGSCGLLNLNKTLPMPLVPGTILYKEEKVNSSTIITDGKVKGALTFSPDSSGYRNGESWVHGIDHLIGSLNYTRKSKGVKSKIVEYDNKGGIVRQVYYAPVGVMIIEPFVSNDDSKIVFRSFDGSHTNDKKSSPETIGISVIDFNSGKLIRTFDIPKELGFVTLMDESPWIGNENKFVCSMWNPSAAKETKTPVNNVSIYVADINTGDVQLIAKEGYSAIGNPKKNSVAFFRGNEVFTYDVDSGQTRKLASIETSPILSLHWLPDGNKIFCRTRNAFTSHDYLIDTETGAVEINPFKLPNWEILTWK